MLTYVFKGQNAMEESCQQQNDMQLGLALLVWKFTECEVVRRCVNGCEVPELIWIFDWRREVAA